MASVGVHNLEGQEVGTVELPEDIFDIEPSADALYFLVKAYQTNRRQGNASTKTRSEVNRSKRKLYRQKGTGRARMGTAGSPIRVGGGVAHGPQPHVFQERVPKKVKQLAIKSAFSLKAQDEKIKVLEDFSLEEPKTQRMAGMTRGLQVDDSKTLLVMAEASEMVTKSCRNLPRLSVLPVNQVSAYDLVKADSLILTQGAIERIQSLWGAP